MLFAAAAVVALVSAAPLAFAQDLSVSAPSLAQCATSTLSVAGSNAPYYVAVLPAQNPCESDAIAEFHNVNGPTVDYTVALPEGTQVQLYISDNSGYEYWSQILTVGGGDASCLGGDPASPSSASPNASSSSTESETTSSTAAPTTYVAPSAARASSTSTRASSGSSGTNNVANSPANAAESESSTSAGFKATASVTLIGGALAAAFALF